MSLKVGDTAPDFEAPSTRGRVKLSELKEKWLLLLTHPSGFNPVCTTEIIALSQRLDEFRKMGVEVFSICSGSLQSHIAWIRDIEDKYGLKILIPVVADPDNRIIGAYGAVDSKGFVSRSVFLIDAERIVRFTVHYPPEVGRNIKELTRVAKAIQTSLKSGLLAPANWEQGELMVTPPPSTMDEAEKKVKDGAERWYLQRKQV
ncbi:MAG: redoxin domain-containing protein [Thermoproteota archaeon]